MYKCRERDPDKQCSKDIIRKNPCENWFGFFCVSYPEEKWLPGIVKGCRNKEHKNPKFIACAVQSHCSSAFEMLDNADLKLGTVIDENKNKIIITQGNFQSIMQNQDRRVR